MTFNDLQKGDLLVEVNQKSLWEVEHRSENTYCFIFQIEKCTNEKETKTIHIARHIADKDEVVYGELKFKCFE